MYRHGGKRPRGKPPAAARLRRDQIVDYLLELRRTEPSKMEEHIKKAADHFGVHHNTAWNAWAEYKPFVVEANGHRFECVPYGEPIIFEFGPLFTLSTSASK